MAGIQWEELVKQRAIKPHMDFGASSSRVVELVLLSPSPRLGSEAEQGGSRSWASCL